MRKKKMIKLVAGGAICALSFAVAAAVPMAKDIASADDYALEMVGAAIRPDENYGIRFTAQTSAVRDGSKYYVMIVPNSWLTDNNYLGDCNDGDYYKHLTEVKELSDVDDPATPNVDERDFITMESVPEKKGDVYEVKGTISNVHFSNTNNKFFGVAYEVLADGQTRVYAESQDKSVRSICYVAGAALNDESAGYSSTMITKLKDTVNDAYDFVTNGAETGATLDLSSFGFVQNSYYTLDKESVTKLEMTGVPTIDLPIEYSVSAGSGTPSTITEDGVLTVNDETGYSFVKAQIAGETKNLTVYNTPQMAEGMLNDFASGSDNNTRTYDMNVYGTDISGGRGYWLNEKADAYGNMGYGVGSVTKGSDACGLRFNVSKAELKAMDIETITVRFLLEVADTGVQSISLNFFWTPEISTPTAMYKLYPVNTWSYYTISKTTDESAWETFMDTYCNTGVGRSAWNTGGFQVFSGSPTLYIDYISVGTQRMAEHELENFDTSAATNNHSGDLGFSATSKAGTYTNTYTDAEGITAYGVVYAQMWYNSGTMATRYGRTEAELLKIMENLDTLTVRLLIKRSGSTEWYFSVFGVRKLITTNTWVDFTVTRDEILAVMTGETEEAKITKFASNFCSTGAANDPRMLSCACSGVVVDVYLDSITYTVSAATAQ